MMVSVAILIVKIIFINLSMCAIRDLTDFLKSKHVVYVYAAL